jgi:multicomponent Na+:H+ antiporter subunit D
VSVLVPLPVVVPLLVAAAIAATGHRLPARLLHAVAIAVATGVTAVTAVLLARSWNGTIVTWFGDWQPRGRVALGISFAVDPIAAGLAAFSALIVTVVLVFSWHYFDETAPLFQTLLLVFLGAMVGFCFTGDLFNLFVFFELMGIAAYALASYAIDQPAPLQGGLSFAITNSIGGFLVLIGIALLYGQTGALNLAQIGSALAEEPADKLVVVAFTMLAAGFLVKAAAAPFHFWLADAYAAAPTPVCAVFAAVMSDLGLYALARVYWSVFSGPFAAHGDGVRDVLLGFACLTMLVGAVMAFLQRHLKRLLAFVTISRGGLFLVGIALLTPQGLAGTSIAVVGDGLAKAALFLGVGILVHVLRSADELRLRGRGRGLWVVAAAFAVGGFVIAGLPPFAGFLGTALIEDSAASLGRGWVRPVIALSSALAAAAILRAGLRVFAGIGPASDPMLTPEEDVPAQEEPRHPRSLRPRAMTASVIVLLVLSLALGFAPRLAVHSEQAAQLAQDRGAYSAAVLEGRHERPPPPSEEAVGLSSYLEALATAAAAVLIACAALGRARLHPSLLRRLTSVLSPPVTRLRLVHSGRVGDYVAWLTVGTATLGVLLTGIAR